MTVETALYRHFSESGALLYVGISKNPMARMEMHACRSPWFRRIVRIEIEWHLSLEAAQSAEADAIHDENPAYNRHVPLRKRNPPKAAPPALPSNPLLVGCVVTGCSKARARMTDALITAGVERGRVCADMRTAAKMAQRQGQRIIVAGTRDLRGTLPLLRSRKVHVLGLPEVARRQNVFHSSASQKRARKNQTGDE